MKSVWGENTEPRRFPPLGESIHTDVLIIGGGLAGLLCAYMLKFRGVDCVLAEADRIAGGVTKNTTAKITLAHGLIYDKLIKRFGAEKAKLYLTAQSAALREYERICGGIACDLEKRDSYVYSLTDREKIEREIRALEILGMNAEFYKDLPLPFKVAGAVKVKNQAQFDPLKFAYAIAKDLPIYEHTKVTELANGRAVANGYKIKCEKILEKIRKQNI